MANVARLELLFELGGDAERESRWREFAEFCRLRARGLRRQAFAALHRFIATTRGWTFGDRREFEKWLLESVSTRGLIEESIPQPLHAELIIPTLLTWREREPDDAAPYLWQAF